MVLREAPTGLTARPPDPNETGIILDWNSFSGAISYTLAWSKEENGIYTEIQGITDISYTHTNLNTEDTYYYKIKAVTLNGESPYSNPVNGNVYSCFLFSPSIGQID